MPFKGQAKFEGQGCDWGGFHFTWAVKVVDHLNGPLLPHDFVSFPICSRGVRAETDSGDRPSGYVPPAASLTGTVRCGGGDLFEVQVRKYRRTVVAAVVLASDTNKNSEQARREFAVRCASYLQDGVSVVVVDVIDDYAADLHGELCDLLDVPPAFRWKSPTGLSAVCYRTVQGRVKPDLAVGNGEVRLDVWTHPLAVGEPLPTVPLWLAADLAVPLELDLTYAAACRSLRLA
jgi:hypothetical protein